MRVFISSTCYDLIDVRAEVAGQLRQIGITPVLSDDKLSEFEVRHDRNSIETCLVNVESCDEFILILDKRYGPPLNSGYGDFSATYLEYKRAIEKSIPVRAYVRDRLNADYSIWKQNGKNGDLKYSWVKDKKDHRLFNFLEDYSKLDASSEDNNFFDTFTNSIDLKAAISKHFEKRVLPKRIAEAIHNNTFPIIDIKVEADNLADRSLKVTTDIRNVSNAPAFNFNTYWEDEDKDDGIATYLLPGQSTPLVVTWTPKTLPTSFDKFEKILNIEYRSLLGILVRDKFSISVKPFHLYNNLIIVGGKLMERHYIRCSEIEIEIQD